MLIREGEHRSPKIDLLLASTLALVAGGANSAGFLAFGYFSANMTGNVSLVSEHISMQEPGLAFAFLAVVAMFILGAFCSSVLINLGKKRQLNNIYALTLLAEAALLCIVGMCISFEIYDGRSTPLAGLLSLTMGIQNAASTRISDSRIRTTHISGIATDIGVGLSLLTGKIAGPERRSTLQRLRLHTVTLFSFLLGGVGGVLGYSEGDAVVFYAFSLLLLAMCIRYLGASRKEDKG